MKKMLIILLFSFLWSFTYSQVIKVSNIILGFENSGTIISPSKYGKQKGIPNIEYFSFSPQIDFRIIKNFYLGGIYEYGFGWVNKERVPSLQSYGIQTKYFSIHLKEINF